MEGFFTHKVHSTNNIHFYLPAEIFLHWTHSIQLSWDGGEIQNEMFLKCSGMIMSHNHFRNGYNSMKSSISA